MSEKTQVLIVGAGFAGISAAIGLKQSNVSFQIFEASPKPHDIGGGITMFPNSMRVLRLLGVAEKLIDTGATLNKLKFGDNEGNHLVNRVNGNPELYGEPTIVTRRTKLNSILLERAKELDISIEYNKKMIDIEDNNDEVKILFEDGTSAVGQIMLGCDGIHSTCRDKTLKKVIEPNYTELMYIGGFVDDQNLIEKLNLDHHTQYASLGPINYFTYGYIDNPNDKNPSLLWWCCLNHEEHLRKEQLKNLKDDDMISKVLENHTQWHHPIEELIRSTNTICKANVNHLPEIEQWHNGRVLLLGDAIHAMDPISGQGAGTALEDGYLISKVIPNGLDNYEQMFTRFTELRKQRVNPIAQKSKRSSGRMKIKMNKYIIKLRNKAFALMTYLTPEKVLNKNFFYDVEEDLNKF